MTVICAVFVYMICGFALITHEKTAFPSRRRPGAWLGLRISNLNFRRFCAKIALPIDADFSVLASPPPPRGGLALYISSQSSIDLLNLN